ncbi:MAG TPA: DmsC/YnfH family molybdoenzyme membrane anchor subunit [Pirellulales bacterium]|jgi:Fe-S-cluster-containing dehydrogenase component/DMSO reductase anchor subunit
MIELPVVSNKSAPIGAACASSSVTGPALISALLEAQQSLAAVDEFNRWHSGDQSRGLIGRQVSPRYRALLPASPPGPGQQYAFEVDLDRCSGCKACVTACHTLNGLDASETWRDVGLLIGGSRNAPVMQHVTAACHHCLEPACMIACPVNAYEKDPTTGIVKHLDDQCFGCQYCTLACPYDVPKYHPDKGIVRKCDMCSSRLAVGEPPACVQACPHEAIAIRTVDRQQIIDDAEAALFLPAAPDPQHTLPTTTYKTQRSYPRNLLPADYFRVNPQHAHWPLAIMLVLTQMSVGAFVAGLTWERLLDGQDGASLRSLHAINSLAFGLLALSASVLHLGRPRYAFRAVLGLRHSWLSREILAFGVFAALASTYAGALLATDLWFKQAQDSSFISILVAACSVEWIGWAVAASGGLGVFCSVMIYVFTRRECWSFTRVAVRFVLTAALLGLTAAWLSILVATVARPSGELLSVIRENGPALCRTILLLAIVKLLWEVALFRHLLLSRMTPLRRSALLQTGELSSVTLARFALGLLGGVVMPILLLNAFPSLSNASVVSFVAMAGLLFVANLVGELLERFLFFAACAAPRMPGGIR